MKFIDRKIKNIKVKVENIVTGDIEKEWDCGTNERRAEKFEDALLSRTNLEKYHVYQSIEV